MHKLLSFSKLAFTGNPIFRDSDKRSDDCVDLALNVKNTYVILMLNGLVLQKDDSPLLLVDEAQKFAPDFKNAVYLGQYRKYNVLAAYSNVGMDAVSAPYLLDSLRGLCIGTKIDAPLVGVLAQASSLLHWHDNNGYCSCCGSQTLMRGGGHRRSCTKCGVEHFPRVDPVAIMLVTWRDKCLLAHNKSFTEKRFSCLAGFIEQGETLEEAVRREVFEEVGIKTNKVGYIASQPWPFPQSLMFGCFVDATEDKIKIDDSELVEARWFDRREVTDMLLEKHENGLNLPPAGSIAHYLIHRWLTKFSKLKV